MNVLSLFDGISCAQIALNRAGIQYDNYFASEIDKYCIQVTQKNYPKTIQLGDVKSVRAETLPNIDLLIGGSPCQGFSFAGHQLNFNDPRSALFFEFTRILEECKPIFFLLENVKMKQEYSDIISKHLGVEPIQINSSLVSAQLRKRLYWTNIPGVCQPEDKNIKLCDIIESGSVDRDKSYCIDANYYKGGSIDNYLNKSRRQLVIKDDSRLITVYTEETEVRKLTPTECEALQTVPKNYTAGVSDTQRYKMLGNSFTVDVIAHIIKGIK